MGSFHTSFIQFLQQGAEVTRVAARNVQIASSQCSGNDEGGGLDTVRNDAMSGAMEFAHTFHTNCGRAATFNMSAHFVEQFGQVGDFRLACAILHNSFTVGECGSHQ